MFGFEKLQVYEKARNFNVEIRREILSNEKLDRVSKDQLRRAAMSIMLNIAEGTSRFSNADEKHFYVIARGSVFECVSILGLLCVEQTINIDQQNNFYTKAEEISKMLFRRISNLRNSPSLKFESGKTGRA
jgi:four helix bundle protein